MNINKFMRRKNGSSKGPKDTKKIAMENNRFARERLPIIHQ